jgi:hypothetical protein
VAAFRGKADARPARRRGIEVLPIRVTQAQLRAIEDKGYLAGHSLVDKVEARFTKYHQSLNRFLIVGLIFFN